MTFTLLDRCTATGAFGMAASCIHAAERGAAGSLRAGRGVPTAPAYHVPGDP